MGTTPRRYGFTLLEVMVALVIFSAISTGAFSLLINLLHSQSVLEEQSEKLETLQVLSLTVQHEVSQALPASLKDSSDTLSFTRLGWRNPLEEPRSTLAMVKYTAAGGNLLRQLWPAAGVTLPAPALTQTLATGAKVTFRTVVLSVPATPGKSAAASMAGAAEISIDFPGIGDIRQLIPVVQAP